MAVLAGREGAVGPSFMLSFFLSWFLHGPQVIEKFDYVFAENGTVQYKHGRLLSKQVSVPKACPQGTPLFHTEVLLSLPQFKPCVHYNRRSRTTWGRNSYRT